jgi:predicted TIM-barrel fold metal-dependent hydrolase
MIIDDHNHPEWYGYTFERFIENMDKNNIDKTWLLSWETPKDEYDPAYNHVIPNAESNGPVPFSLCREFARKAPDRFILGYAPDPRKPEAIDNLDFAVKTYGVRICGELKLRMTYDNPDALRMYQYCGEHKLPVLMHIDYEFYTGNSYPRPNWWYGGGIGAFERAAKHCPETIFIGHAPGFWVHISEEDEDVKVDYPDGKVKPGGILIELLRKYPNIYCDISAGSGLNALSRDPEFARQFLIEFQDKILYGRDYFDNLHQEFLNKLGLPDDVLEKIYSGNALKLVPLQ